MIRSQDWIGLLRGIGPTTHAKMPMAALRAACEKAGLEQVQTVLATGNLVFRSIWKRHKSKDSHGKRSVMRRKRPVKRWMWSWMKERI